MPEPTTKRIIYTRPDGGLSVVIPCAPLLPDETEADYLARIAATDVPAGLAYRIVDRADLPADRADRDAWADTGSAVVVSPTRRAALAQAVRDRARDLLAAARQDLALALRALALAAGDGDNVLRAWVASFKSAVAASTSLADLKTRVAALPDLAQLTPTAIKTAVAGKATGGTAD